MPGIAYPDRKNLFAIINPIKNYRGSDVRTHLDIFVFPLPHNTVWIRVLALNGFAKIDIFRNLYSFKNACYAIPDKYDCMFIFPLPVGIRISSAF